MWGIPGAHQWLGLGASSAESSDSIPKKGTKISQAVWHGPKKKKSLRHVIVLKAYKVLFLTTKLEISF